MLSASGGRAASTKSGSGPARPGRPQKAYEDDALVTLSCDSFVLPANPVPSTRNGMMSLSLSFVGGSVKGSSISFLMKSLTQAVLRARGEGAYRRVLGDARRRQRGSAGALEPARSTTYETAMPLGRSTVAGLMLVSAFFVSGQM